MVIKRLAISQENKIELEITTHEVNLEPFSTNEIPNGGGEDTTDWINPTTGLAAWWAENILL